MRQFMVMRLQQLCQLEALLEARPAFISEGGLHAGLIAVLVLTPHNFVCFAQVALEHTPPAFCLPSQSGISLESKASDVQLCFKQSVIDVQWNGKYMTHVLANIMQGKPKARTAKAKHQPWERGSRCPSVLLFSRLVQHQWIHSCQSHYLAIHTCACCHKQSAAI